MTNPIFHLFQLQKLDIRLDALHSRLKEINVILSNDKSVIEAQEQFFLVSSILSETKKASGEIEEQIKIRKLKIEQSESSLYSGIIKNPKELQDVQKEIASIKSTIASLEDKELVKMVEIDDLEREYLIAENTLNLRKDQSLERNNELIIESNAHQQEISKIEIESKAILDQIPLDYQEKYKNLRARKKGIAISRVEDNSCSVCGSSLTPADCQLAKSSSNVVFCNSCGRILYAG